MEKVAYIFPGQGSQYVGMGKELYDSSDEARIVIDTADKTLPDMDIKRLMFEGPIEELTRTKNSQVCILVYSIACMKAFESKRKNDLEIACTAGLSLGELTSLAAADSIGFEDAVRLVSVRGLIMEEASLKNPGSMASIIGMDLGILKDICRGTGAEIANLNSPGQVVISGRVEDVEKAMKEALSKGAKRAIALAVSGAFHSTLMKPSSEKFRSELDKVAIREPKYDIISNVTADKEVSVDEIKDNLVKQLYSPVRWEESVRNISKKGINIFFEIGPGKVLKGLIRRIDPNLKVYNIEKLEDMDIDLSNL